jgi:hypothetical protein
MDLDCRAWSPDATHLLCQASRFEGDPSLNGIYTIRASDGGGLARLTVNPYPPTGNFGGGDVPGDYSPDGTQFVFMRAKPGAGPVPDRNQTGALFVENTDGTGLRQLTPYGLANSHDNGLAHWSPDGSKILFASVNGPFGSASLFVIHPDGSGLRPIPLDTGGVTSLAFTPGWSPDGASIVVTLFLRATSQADIYTARSDGTHVAQVTNTPDFEDFADWGTHPWPPSQIADSWTLEAAEAVCDDHQGQLKVLDLVSRLADRSLRPEAEPRRVVSAAGDHPGLRHRAAAGDRPDGGAPKASRPLPAPGPGEPITSRERRVAAGAGGRRR